MIDVLPLVTYAFVMCITPGPNNVMLAASGARFGFRRTVPQIVGIAVGHAMLVFAACAGLAAVLMRWPQIQTLLRWGGAAYLLVLGWKLLRSDSGDAEQSARPISFLEAAVFQFLNPKGWVMALTTASLFLPAGWPFALASAYVVGVTTIINMPCTTVWALFGNAFRAHLGVPRRRLAFNVVMSVALAGTGIAMVA